MCSACDVLGDVVHVRRVGRGAQRVRLEALGLPDEVDREAPHPLARLAQDRGRERRDRARVEPAGQQHAARHVGDQLTADGVFEQRADVRDGRVGVALVRLRARAASSGARAARRHRR